ncbi:MAG: N-acetylmuramoyl-L-alanine amidase [Micromonosporaceae bacterium]
MAENQISRRNLLLATGAGALAAPLVGAAPAMATHQKVYIDPGHGGSDSGAVGNGLREKDLTLKIALRMRRYLLDHWYVNIRMSRTTDVYRSLSYRSSDANSWGAHRFVSIHINSASATSAKGFESYRYPGTTGTTYNLQNTMHSNVLSWMNRNHTVVDRGLKTADFHVLRETSMPAVLTENLFISNYNDSQRLKSDTFLWNVAKGHAFGIAKHLGLTHR